MEYSEKKYQLISQYILGELHGKSLEEFEIELSKDKALREEVELHRELSSFISNDNEALLRENIQKLKTDIQSAPKQNNKIILWVAVGLFVVLSFYFVQRFLSNDNSEIEPHNNSTPALPINDTIAQTQTINKGTGSIESESNTQSIDKGVEAPKDRSAKMRRQLPQTKKETPTTRQVMAMADFSPNKTLDYLIESNTRSIGFVFDLVEKIENQSYKNEQPVHLKFSGKIESSSLIEEDLIFYIFSNKKKDYSNFKPLSQSSPQLDSKDNVHNILIDKKIMLKPGLYYYLLESSDEELLYINKFTVK